MDYSYASVSAAVSRRRPLVATNTRGQNIHSPSGNSQQQQQQQSLSSSSNQATHSQSQQQQQKRNNNQHLKRSLKLTDLIFYGVGCSVGAGIYSLVGIGANLAGPSIAVSFLLCGVACCFTSLAYAEFAARVPLAGSAYTFTYVSFGELCGWLVGWNLTLGYAISAAVVARSWAEYISGFLQGIAQVYNSHDSALVDTDGTTSWWRWLTHAPIHIPFLNTEGDAVYECCPLAIVIVALSTVVLITGAKESTRFNTAMTILNLSVLGFVLLTGLTSGTIHVDNLQPMFPHGVSGMARGAGLVFFAFLGFDMVSCLSEEVENPARNMPIGIIGSLLASMSIYVAISLAVVGMVPISLLGGEVPIVNALFANACCSHEEQLAYGISDGSQQVCLSHAKCDPPPLAQFPASLLYYGSHLVSFGAIFGLTTATFACLMGQPRIFYSMAQDGLLFKVYAKVHPKTGVPTVGTVLTGILTAVVACFIDLEFLANAISLGTLQVFTFVNAGVIILRTRPLEVPSYSLDDHSSLDLTHDDDDSDNSDHYNESSPLVRDAETAAAARSLGLIKKSSRAIRASSTNNASSTSVPNYQRSSSSTSNININKESNVHKNGSKPHWLTLIFTISSVIASAALANDWGLTLILLPALAAATCACLLFTLPHVSKPDTFACPWVPFVPLMGILCNSYMMGSLPVASWSVISIWLLVGLLFYFSYGIHHSELRSTQQDQQQKDTEMASGIRGMVQDSPASSAILQDHNDGYSSIPPSNNF